MQIKRFEAKNMADAFSRIKLEFGAEAVILSARHIKKGHGFLGVRKTTGVEVTAARDLTHPTNNPVFPAGTMTDDSSRYRPGARHIGVSSKISNSVRQPVKKTSSSTRSPGSGWQNTLKEHGVADGYIEKITRLANRADIDASNPADLIRRFWVSRGVIDASDHRNGAEKPIGKDCSNRRIFTFVGPPGSGKTTTLSKLAAKAAVTDHKTVGIITLDDRRLGAAYQLKTFARILELPVLLAADDDAFQNALDRLRERELIFVDTPGIGAKDTELFESVHDCLEKTTADDRVYLVLAATTADADMSFQTERFLSLSPDGFVFTRLDETPCRGTIFNQSARYRLPIFYTASGQNIPEDIESASLSRLIDGLLYLPKMRIGSGKKIDPDRNGNAESRPPLYGAL